jgi:hypothetical protein
MTEGNYLNPIKFLRAILDALDQEIPVYFVQLELPLDHAKRVIERFNQIVEEEKATLPLYAKVKEFANDERHRETCARVSASTNFLFPDTPCDCNVPQKSGVKILRKPGQKSVPVTEKSPYNNKKTTGRNPQHERNPKYFPWELQKLERGEWVFFQRQKTALGARQNGKHFSRAFDTGVRLLKDGQVLDEWNKGMRTGAAWRDK